MYGQESRTRSGHATGHAKVVFTFIKQCFFEFTVMETGHEPDTQIIYGIYGFARPSIKIIYGIYGIYGFSIYGHENRTRPDTLRTRRP